MRRKSLLIVEDDLDANRLMSNMLSVNLPGVTIFHADSGSTALRMFIEHDPELVITDIKLPEPDGVGLAERIKRIKPDTKIIVVTGYSDQIEAFERLAIQDYFVKPTDFDKLLLSIRRALA